MEHDQMVTGVPAGRLFARDMHRPSRGIRVPRSCGPDLPALVRSHTALDPDDFAALITAAELHGVPLPPWAEFRPDGGGPVTAVVEPVPWGKKSGPHFREPGRFCTSPGKAARHSRDGAGSPGTGSRSARVIWLRLTD
ncbi:hypothetical protein LFT45_18745 [Arthrobacter sp. FW305-BF8]|uniref:hypothetical protein n=1 Tax=Arthrobacter sp. FW305-BF8 TaxID=2879617 RepID=UPI001F31E056|nr:hypothetical protein [Arthrobacter sp. FW305-BF8]UKA53724.1 hypothetical protein LFT45_18745 [Arthrobacter sp. FW305-BF8]